MLSTRSNRTPGGRIADRVRRDWFIPSIGLFLWLAWLLLARPLRTPGILMLSPFVIVPLVLQLVVRSDAGEQRLLAWVRVAVVPCALVAALAFSLEQGARAMALTLPWLGVTLLCAVEGALRLMGRRIWRSAYLGFDLALMFIAVGGAWMATSRQGLTLGFTAPIVELTAVHFHYAGFALPAVVAALGTHRFGGSQEGGTLPLAVAAGIIATAGGITFGGVLEWVGATAMAVIGLVVAWRLLEFAITRHGTERAAFGVAGVTLAGGMVMALIWSWTVWFGVSGPGLQLMVAVHGSLNAIGFGLLAVVGFTIVGVPLCPERRSLRLGQPTPAELDALARETFPAPIEHPEVFGSEHPAGWRRDAFAAAGPATFDEATTAMTEWAGHRAAGITLASDVPIEVGQTVAIAIPFFGLATVTAKARITQVIDESGRYGFSYASTGHHPMDGTEAFIIEEADGGVTEAIPVVWRPAILGARLVPPLTRWLQRRALGRYLGAIVGS